MANQGDLPPRGVRDAVEFVGLMRQLKERSGLTYRQLEDRAAEFGEVLARSTLADVLGGKTLPRPELLAAFVRACGDGDRVAVWLQAWCEISGRPEQRAQQGPLVQPETPSTATEPPRAVPAMEPPRAVPRAARTGPFPVRLLAAATIVCAALAAATAWALASSGEPPTEETEGARSARPAHSGAWPEPPSGWVRIRPVTAPGLCLTDGRVRDGRYVPLVAVQRPCGEVAPQGTVLEPVGGDKYRIQWHHPDYGKGCLMALSEGPGAGLLEPIDDCRQDSRIRVEPSGAYGAGRYVLRVDGQGCVGIKGSGRDEGTEAVMERCVGKGGQVFFIEPAS
ncbi:helix-turn-helix domain-containing protein [Streptomyces sp. NPDC057539]|uniref:helix-turn-helix domain-containing protein n=1 Tax=Streptomyces sp. NPDC057539 TaxID=3346159 RepID=UPI00368CCFF0